MTDDVGKVEVECDENPNLRDGLGENIGIWGAGQSFFPGKLNVMTQLTQYGCHSVWDILIQLDAHHYAVMGTMRSRAKSAAYASAAGIASGGSVGYWSCSSSALTPAARLSSTT